MAVSGTGGGPLNADARVPTLFGVALSFADHLGAADVLPPRFGDLSPMDATARLFADLDASLASRLDAGGVLVAGHRLGHGAGGAAAARALAAAGFVAVVAGSFADDVDEHCLAAGLPALEADAPFVFHTGQRVRINCEAGTIANLSSGDRQPIRNASDAMIARWRERLGQ
jgi:3-isopropylmalate dehydratase small subunit